MRYTSKFFAILSILICFSFIHSFSQDDKKDRTYSENSGELIFSFADVIRSGQDMATPMRFSMFFHGGKNYHLDFNNNIGMYTGWGLRNVGYITEENDIKIKRRSYSFGIPLALKIGLMDKRVYIYGGGSYELFFHYKQKRLEGGDKRKYSEWFSARTERFSPSLFAGIQFPKGINLKFKYYLNDFLNRDFTGSDFGQPVDYSEYTKSNIFYFALTFNFKPEDLGIKPDLNKETVRYTSIIK